MHVHKTKYIQIKPLTGIELITHPLNRPIYFSHKYNKDLLYIVCLCSLVFSLFAYSYINKQFIKFYYNKNMSI